MTTVALLIHAGRFDADDACVERDLDSRVSRTSLFA